MLNPSPVPCELAYKLEESNATIQEQEETLPKEKIIPSESYQDIEKKEPDINE